MAKKKKGAPAGGKLAGQTVAFVGKFGHSWNNDLETMQALVAAEGGSIVDGLKTAPDILVAGDGVGGNPPAAVAKIQKKHPGLQSIDQAGFYQIVNPTAEEFRELMISGPRDDDFWRALADRLEKGGIALDLTGSDFRNLTIAGILYSVRLDDCDFRGANISAAFDDVTGAKFDGATMTGASFSKTKDCSLKNVVMTNTDWTMTEFMHCDFSGARLKIEGGYNATATDCKFKKADLSKTRLGDSTFTGSDFSGTNLTEANLHKCDFTGANLAGTDLSRADLRGAKFKNADLRKAKFKDAILSGADLAGATIDGADFTGATLTTVNLAGLDLSKAKNLVQTAARTVGPNLRKLAKIAKSSKRFSTSIELELGKDEYATLKSDLSVYGSQSYATAGYQHSSQTCNLGSEVDAPTFERGLLNLIDLWSRGKPRFDTVTVEARQCPLRGKELMDLAIAAWYEACGLEVPSAEELQQAATKSAADKAGLRETLIAELISGPAGVKKWNERSEKERQSIGKIRKHDFAKAKLAGANLENLDLEGGKFDGANMKKAQFCRSELKGASFVKTDLSGANLATCKSSDASFEGATLTHCNLGWANFRRCNFRAADLSNADLDHSDICGADFSAATLDGVNFENTKFDEKTILPSDFVPPDGMQWKGVGLRPGTPAPPPPPQSGTLDFAAFLEQLNGKVEQARMQKAGSMLKAERFELFAEVKDDSLAGIVKSQSSKDLVYSCRLVSDGTFGCCTQNLRPCGGLRGALCKHLLVLIVGLAKAGRLDSATVDHWIDLSRSQKPAIDEDSRSATFLRYKGAEAGEVDWRPTETIPEDFYAM